jgi:hypothetical protein
MAVLAPPKVIETREEFDRAVVLMEDLDRREVRGDSLSREELALRCWSNWSRCTTTASSCPRPRRIA